jgi:hypothetical protein
MFLAPGNNHPTHHHLPRNPPQLHHKNTTATHRIFQTPPSKTPENRRFDSPIRHTQIFSENPNEIFKI